MTHNGSTCLLTAAHVAGLVRPHDLVDSVVIQPGRKFHKQTSSQVASIVSSDFETDSVLARIDDGIECVSDRVAGIGRVKKEAGVAVNQMRVSSCGMSSGYRQSRIRSAYVDSLLEYAPGFYRLFAELIVINNGPRLNFGMASEGDSGCWVYSQHRQVLGMAVWASRKYVWAVPMQAILKAHNADFVK